MRDAQRAGRGRQAQRREVAQRLGMARHKGHRAPQLPDDRRPNRLSSAAHSVVYSIWLYEVMA